MKILLHTCCAPCMTYPMKVLSERGYQVVPYFYNPNIHPFREYQNRYLAVLDYCREQGVDLEVGPYEMERFLLEVSPRVDTRCELCFRIRLSRVARQASILGIGEFYTENARLPGHTRKPYSEAELAAGINTGRDLEQEPLHLVRPDLQVHTLLAAVIQDCQVTILIFPERMYVPVARSATSRRLMSRTSEGS